MSKANMKNSTSDWGGAQWIWNDRLCYATTPPAPHFRKEFHIRPGVRQAILHITARGIFEASLDGRKIGQDYLTPGWTDFRQHIPYLSYDVTDRLGAGTHALGAIIADGWCCGNLTIKRFRNFYHEHPELLARLEIAYDDGKTDCVVTDGTWTTSTGPILSADLYDGENYDARQEMPGWDTVSFTGKGWHPVAVGEMACASPELVPKNAPPVRVMHELKPVRIFNPQNDVYIWDFGQNFAGTFRCYLKGYDGRLYTFRTAEMLDEHKLLYTLNYRSARSTDSYICGYGQRDTAREYSPRFTFHGFRYLQIDGFQFDGYKPEELNVTALVLYSTMPQISNFTCGNPLINRLWLNAVWGQRSNFIDLPIDCPQRDERMGWTGDSQVFAATALYNMDALEFYRSYLRNVREAAADDGAAPSIAPAILRLWDGAAGWGDAIIIIPWVLYKHYGCKNVLEENYTAMQRAFAWQVKHSEACIRPDKGYGDWLALEKTPVDLVQTAYFAHCADLLAQIAGVLELSGDAQDYRRHCEKIRTAFQGKFLDASGIVTPATQTALLMALAFDLLPVDKIAANCAALRGNIEANGSKMATGFLGTALLCETLARFGMEKLACDLLLQEEYPSWLFSVKQGATTFWERWNSFTLEDGFGDVSMNSFNHYAYGSVAKFIVNSIGGIDYSDGEVRLQPIFDERFSPVDLFYDSPRGRICSRWEKNGGKTTWEVEVPDGVNAIACLPNGTTHAIRKQAKFEL